MDPTLGGRAVLFGVHFRTVIGDHSPRRGIMGRGRECRAGDGERGHTQMTSHGQAAWELLLPAAAAPARRRG
ncbi:hypothetical protein, partial [Streptomyces sp. NPDC039028]|uniref:hypothetical protein n=1 Tax=Streptomyces sp. NPDC039028 TaxID=3155370 RepID=UPI0033CBC2C4